MLVLEVIDAAGLRRVTDDDMPPAKLPVTECQGCFAPTEPMYRFVQTAIAIRADGTEAKVGRWVECGWFCERCRSGIEEDAA